MSRPIFSNVHLVAAVIALGLGVSMTYSASARAAEDGPVDCPSVDISSRGEVKPDPPDVKPSTPFNPPPEFEPAKNK